MKVAVIGTGIAGNAAAWTLSKRYPVTVYDRETRPGGHSHTVSIDYEGTPISVDTGFIVYNELNYPGLTALFDHLGVETVESCMSFAVTADAGRFEWKGGGKNWIEMAIGLFAQPRNLLSPSYLWMLRDILTFNQQSIADHRAGRLAGLTLGEYFRRNHFTPRLLTDYLAPMGAAIWSAPSEEMLNFPAENFVAFFSNHRLLQYDRPVWRTVKGGSRNYVDKLTAAFRDRLRLGCAVTSIERTPHGVVVNDSQGGSATYDHVVIAAHSDQALDMLCDADAQERQILGAIGYAPNTVYLHRDQRLMPKRRRAWASWNFLRWQREGVPVNDVAVTYWMNRLQGIDHSKPVFVSLNPPFEPDAKLTFGKYICEHPQYNAAAFAAQKRLGEIQGRRRTWFCGAWTGYGFHEDGLRSGLEVAQALGAAAPWRELPAELAEAAELMMSNPTKRCDDPAALYFGEVMHARLKPMGHRFSYRVMSLLIDLDRLDEADIQSPLFGVNRAALYSFHEADHGKRDGSSLREHAQRCAAAHGIDLTGGKVKLLGYPRLLGFAFNPLSVYFCHRADGELALIIYEVRNTFGDIHSYVLPVRSGEASAAGIRQHQDKQFYVSPFVEMEMRYHFRILPPGETVRLRILEADREGPLLAATFLGRRRALSTAALLHSFVTLPLVTLKIVAAIHWEALRLWLKGARLVARPAAAEAREATLPVGEGNQYARLALPARAKALWSGGDRA